MIHGSTTSHFGNCIPALGANEQIIFNLSFLNGRTPYEVNTTARCATMVLFQMIVLTFDLCIFSAMITLLVGLLIYTEACLLDIESLFDQVDRLSKHKNTGQSMVERCKQAVDLHGRLNGYFVKFKKPNFPP